MGQHNHPAPTLKATKQRKVLPPKHKAPAFKQGLNADHTSSNCTNGGCSYHAVAEASGASSAATTTELGSDAWGGSNLPWPVSTTTTTSSHHQVPLHSLHPPFNPHVLANSHWGTHASMPLSFSAAVSQSLPHSLSSLPYPPPNHFQLHASAQLPAVSANLKLKTTNNHSSSSSLSAGSEQHTATAAAHLSVHEHNATATKADVPASVHASAGSSQQQDQEHNSWVHVLLQQLHQQSPHQQVHSSALLQAMCSPECVAQQHADKAGAVQQHAGTGSPESDGQQNLFGLLQSKHAGSSNNSSHTDQRLAGDCGGPVVLGRSVLGDAGQPSASVNLATNIPNSSSNSSSPPEVHKSDRYTPLLNISNLGLWGQLGLGSSSLGLQSGVSFDGLMQQLIESSSKPLGLPLVSPLPVSGLVNGEVEQHSTNNSQLLQLQAVLASLPQRQQ